VHGPEFDGHQVDFDELTQRLEAYKEDEAIAYEKYRCECQVG
jgi:ferredoxin--NADP+ reductase